MVCGVSYLGAIWRDKIITSKLTKITDFGRPIIKEK